MRSLAARCIPAFVVTAAVAVLAARLSGDESSAPPASIRPAVVYPSDPGPPQRTYDEPDDPIEAVLSRASRRIFSDFPKDYAREASEKGLRELDEAIRVRPDDPRLHWFRAHTLTRMERTAEARASREEAILQARNVRGGEDLVDEYTSDHVSACAREGDAVAAAAGLLTLLDRGPGAVGLYKSASIWLGDKKRGEPKAPGPGRLFPDWRRFEPFWGPLGRFFETHDGPNDAAALGRIPERVKPGMDYREALRSAGFPNFNMGRCHWDHGFAVVDECLEYTLDPPRIVREEGRIGAVPPADPLTVHVVIVDGRVVKVATTRGRPPEGEEKPRRHGERISFDYGRNGIAAVAFSPDGRLVAAGTLSGFVSIREIAGGREVLKLSVPEAEKARASGFPAALAFSPNGHLITAGGTYDASAHVWEVPGGAYRGALVSHLVPAGEGRMDRVEALAFSPDGATLATVGSDRDLRLWDVASGRLRLRARGHQHEVKAVAFAPDGRTLATGDDRGTIRLWDVASARPSAAWPGFSRGVAGLVFTPNGKSLAVSREYADAELREVPSGRRRTTFRRSLAHGSPGMAFSPDGRTLAISGAWDAATLWDTADGRRIGVLEGHARFPEGIAFAPDGRSIATGGMDGNLKLWDIPPRP